MQNIKKIRIENFRGIKNLEIPTKSLNIIVGPNNTGKSSLLEALAIGLSSLNDLEDDLERNIFDILLKDKVYTKKYLFRDKYAKINISLENELVSLKLHYLENGLSYNGKQNVFIYYDDLISKLALRSAFSNFDSSEEIKERLIQNETFQSYIKEEQNNIYQIMFEGLLETEKIVLDISINEEEGWTYIIPGLRIDYDDWKYSRFNRKRTRYSAYNKIINKDRKNKKIPIIFDFESQRDMERIDQLHDKVVKLNKMTEVVSGLKKHITYLSDVRKGGDEIFVSLEDQNKPIPISSMGNGFIAMLNLIFISTIANNGVAILEEPEISLHPGFMKIIAETLVKSSNETQFFLTTHSSDLIQYIIDKAYSLKKIENINIIRLKKRNDISDVDVEIMSGAEAKEEIDKIKTDLRGY